LSAITEYFKAAVESAQQTAAELSAAEQETLERQAAALPLRRDMVTLLSYVRDNTVIGTQSTGNLPLKAVREITARFVDPPKLEEQVGTYTFRVRSEADLWPLYYLHILADVGGLAKGAAQLVAATGLRWPVPDADIARMVLHGMIRRMIFSILNDFGAVTLDFEEKPMGTGTIKELIKFRLTPFGKQLLNALVL
jgi:hypothetical protein